MSDPDPLTKSTTAITWDDVLAPGRAARSDWLELFAKLSAPEPPEGEFSLELASFLAAQSLLIYRESEERNTVWSQLALRECLCTEDADTLCSIIEPRSTDVETRPTLAVFRGTTNLRHWLTNLQSLPKPWGAGGHVHGGFADAHEQIWRRIAPRLHRIIAAGRPVVLTGHSLGAALATLTLSRLLAIHGAAAEVCAYTFGSPRVGNTEFADSLQHGRLFRFVRSQDLVTRLPLPFKPSRRLSFHHAGDGYFLDPGTAGLQSRGRGDLEEERASLTQLKDLLASAFATLGKSHPPPFLADHAPIAYVESIRAAVGR